MTTQTPETIPTVALTLKDMAALRKENKATNDLLKAQMDAIRTNKKAEESKEIEALIGDLTGMDKLTFIVESHGTIHELTLTEALVTGKQIMIPVKDSKADELKERAHTLFLDSARVLSLQKAMKRVKLIASNEEIRPKSNKVIEEAKVETPEEIKEEVKEETVTDVAEVIPEAVKTHKGKKNKGVIA